jgi:3-oxoacyl-[acyl-carrier-protein] synthase II
MCLLIVVDRISHSFYYSEYQFDMDFYMKRRVVITSMEACTSIGNDVDTFWTNLIKGKSGVTRISSFDPSPYPTQIAAEVKNFNIREDYPHLYKPKRYSRAAQMALYSAKRAIAQSGLTENELRQAGTFMGTGLGGSPQSEDAYECFYTQRWRRIPALTITRAMPNSIANNIAIECALGGKNITYANACNSSAEAIGAAYEQIQWGKLPLAICGGAESMLWESMMAAWCKLRVMSTSNELPEKASRPFDKARDGMVMAEGAGIIILEDYEHALARGAKPLGEIVGFASSCDAHHITAPEVEGQSRAIRGALDDGNLAPSDVHYINAHGTATKLNDVVETQSIKEVFGKKAQDIPVSSIKSSIGHAIGAAGVLEIIATTKTLQENIIPATLNFSEPEDGCDLDYVPNEARKQHVDIALSNHFAFGGANCALVLKAF